MKKTANKRKSNLKKELYVSPKVKEVKTAIYAGGCGDWASSCGEMQHKKHGPGCGDWASTCGKLIAKV